MDHTNFGQYFSLSDELRGAQINSFMELNLFKILEEHLPPEKYTEMKTGFLGPIFQLGDRLQFSAQLANYVLMKEIKTPKLQEMWFNISEKVARFSLVEYAVITGLNCNQPLPEHNVIILDISAELGLQKSTYENLLDLFKKESDVVKKIRFAYVLVVEGVLLCKRKNGALDPFVYSISSDMQLFSTYPWGRRSYNMLLSSLKNRNRSARDSGSKRIGYNIHGYALAFQVWILETYPSFIEVANVKACPEKSIPYCIRWSSLSKIVLTKRRFEKVAFIKPFKSVIPFYSDIGDLAYLQFDNEVQDERFDEYIQMMKNNYMDDLAPDVDLESEDTDSGDFVLSKRKLSKQMNRDKGKEDKGDVFKKQKKHVNVDETLSGTPIGDIFLVSKPMKVLHSKLMLPRPRKDVLVSQKKDATVSQIMEKLKLPRVEEDEQKCAPSKKNSPPNLREIMERQEVQEKLLKDIELKVNDQSLLLGKAMKDLKDILAYLKRNDKSSDDGNGYCQESFPQDDKVQEQKLVKESKLVDQNLSSEEVQGKGLEIDDIKDVAQEKSDGIVDELLAADEQQNTLTVAPLEKKVVVYSRRKTKKQAFEGPLRRSTRDQKSSAALCSPFVVQVKKKVPPTVSEVEKKEPPTMPEVEKKEPPTMPKYSFYDSIERNAFYRWLYDAEDTKIIQGCEDGLSKEFFRTAATPGVWLSDSHWNEALFYMRKRVHDNPEKYKNIVILDWIWYKLFDPKMVRKYISGDAKIPHLFDKYFDGTCPEHFGKSWFYDVTIVYTPILVENHFLALEIDLLQSTIKVMDSYLGLFNDKKVVHLLKPMCTLLPFLMRKTMKFDHLGGIEKEFTIFRDKDLPQDISSGNCGVYAIKFLEHVAFGRSLEDLDEAHLPAHREKLAIDLFKQTWVWDLLHEVFLNDDEKREKLNEEEETLTEQAFWKEGVRMVDDIEMKKLPPKTSKKKSIIDDDVPKFSLGISSLSL